MVTTDITHDKQHRRERRGVAVDVPGLSAALGIPVVTSIAVRKGGTGKLLRLTDEEDQEFSSVWNAVARG